MFVTTCPYLYSPPLYTQLDNIDVYSLGHVFGENTKPSTEEMTDFYALTRHNHGNLVSSRYH